MADTTENDPELVLYGLDFTKPWDGGWKDFQPTLGDAIEEMERSKMFWSEHENGWKDPERLAASKDPEHRLARHQQALANRRAKLFAVAHENLQRGISDREMLLKADRIISWMSEYVAQMVPVENRLGELNAFMRYIERHYPDRAEGGVPRGESI
jgi:hypothetical protein